MSNGTRLFLVVVITVVIAVAIGATIGLLRNEGISAGGGFTAVLGGMVAGRIALAMLKATEPKGSGKK